MDVQNHQFFVARQGVLGAWGGGIKSDAREEKSNNKKWEIVSVFTNVSYRQDSWKLLRPAGEREGAL